MILSCCSFFLCMRNYSLAKLKQYFAFGASTTVFLVLVGWIFSFIEKDYTFYHSFAGIASYTLALVIKKIIEK